jgi:hypothetical protein
MDFLAASFFNSTLQKGESNTRTDRKYRAVIYGEKWDGSYIEQQKLHSILMKLLILCCGNNITQGYTNAIDNIRCKQHKQETYQLEI